MAEHSPANAETGVVEHGEVHAEPAALGFDASGWVAIAMLAVFALLLWKKVPAAIGAALDRRIDAIKSQLDEAAQLRADAEALREEYRAKAESADAERAVMLERAQAEADAIRRQAEADSAALIERRQRMAEDRIAAAERVAIEAVRARAATVAAAAAEQLIRERLDDKADNALVDEVIGTLGQG